MTTILGLGLAAMLMFNPIAAAQISGPSSNTSLDAAPITVSVPFDSLKADNQPVQPKKVFVFATGYASTPEETDDTPHITANGTYVFDGLVAANFLPFGTKIRIPALFGDKIFTVEDRMNSRFKNRVDIWFETVSEARKFGIHSVEIEIL